MIKRSVLGATLLLGASVAVAQPGPDSTPTADPAAAPVAVPASSPSPSPVPPAPVDPADLPDEGVVNDANAGKAWLMPTGLMDPAGTWSFSDYELFLISGSYAITNNFAISATTLIPITNDTPFWGLATAKLQVVRAGSVRVALQGGVMYASGGGDDSFTVGEVGGAGTVCLDAGCNSHVSGFVGAGIASADQSAVPLLISAAGVFRVSRRLKLMLEFDTGYIAGGGVNDTVDGGLLWYGLRFTSREIGVDFGLVKPVGDVDTDFFPLGFPFVAFTYRAL